MSKKPAFADLFKSIPVKPKTETAAELPRSERPTRDDRPPAAAPPPTEATQAAKVPDAREMLADLQTLPDGPRRREIFHKMLRNFAARGNPMMVCTILAQMNGDGVALDQLSTIARAAQSTGYVRPHQLEWIEDRIARITRAMGYDPRTHDAPNVPANGLQPAAPKLGAALLEGDSERFVKLALEAQGFNDGTPPKALA